MRENQQFLNLKIKVKTVVSAIRLTKSTRIRRKIIYDDRISKSRIGHIKAMTRDLNISYRSYSLGKQGLEKSLETEK